MCKPSHIVLITEGGAGSNTQLRIETSEDDVRIVISDDKKTVTITAPTSFKDLRGDTEIMSDDGEYTPTTTEEEANGQRVPTDPAIKYAVYEALGTRD